MTDIEKRAHDIAVWILPYTLKEFDPEFTFLTLNEDGVSHDFNPYDVVDEYASLYEALLKDLRECGKF